MMMQPTPRTPFEMIEPQLFFELLIALFNLPPVMGPAEHLFDRGVERRITEIVFVTAIAMALKE